MKTGKTSAATLGLVGGVVLGAWIGSELTTSRANVPEPAAVTTQAVQESTAPAVPAKPMRATRVMLMSFFDLESNLIRDRVKTAGDQQAKTANILVNRTVRNLEYLPPGRPGGRYEHQ